MRRLGLTLTAAVLAGPVLAQSLAEVAARDKERRARQGSRPAPAYTDADLRASPSSSPSPSPSPSPISWQGAPPRPKGWTAPSPSPSPRGAAAAPRTASPSPSPEPPDRSAQERAALEARWRAVARERRETLARAEARVADLEARITALRNDLSPVGLGDPNREQTRQAAIGQAQSELEAARAALAVAQKAVDDLEDDARRAGALPGWVR
jgi:hypothetical protein